MILHRRHQPPFLRLSPGHWPGVLLLLVAGLALAPIAAAQQVGGLVFDPVVLGEPTPGAGDGRDNDVPEEESAAEAARLAERIARYRSQIPATEEEEGPYAQSLLEQRRALAGLLQQDGRHEEAIETLDAAMQGMKINEGLFTGSQIPLVEDRIASHVALGQLEQARNMREYLFYLQRKNYRPGSPEYRAALDRWTRLNISDFLSGAFRGTAGTREEVDLALNQPPPDPGMSVNDPHPNVALMENLMGAPSMQSPGMAMMEDPRLLPANTLYEELLAQLQADDIDTLRERQAVTRALANISFTIKARIDELETPNYGRAISRSRSLRSYTSDPLLTRKYTEFSDKLATLVQDFRAHEDATLEDVLGAYLDLADWHLGFNYAAKARRLYREAYDYLLSQGVAPAEADTMLSPAPAQQVPTFATHHYSRQLWSIGADEKLDYAGYLVVNGDKLKDGGLENLRITAVTSNTPDRLLPFLLRHLSTVRVRPSFENGEPVDVKGFTLRYYYAL